MTTFTVISTLTLSVALAVLFLAGKWQLFKKMGEAGWKSLIPVYSEYLLFKNTWNTKMFLASIVTSVAGAEFINFAVTGGSSVNPVLAVIGTVFATAAFVIDTTLLYKLAKSFGHGVGYTVGLFVAEPLFVMIMGFGKSEYAGA